MPGRRLSFGPFTVDQDAWIVLRDGEPMSVGHRGVLLLDALLRRPGEVITKTELMDAAWGRSAVEESNLSVQIAALRKSLGPAPGGGEWIATIPRVGYRFVGPVGGTAPEAQTAAEKPSIAVLPFVNLSSDPEQRFFADGLAEEIITALSRLPGLIVIARSSSFAYRGDGIDIRKVAEELDVGHVLTGSLRRSGNRLRMSVQLAEGCAGHHVWAETYDRELADIFAIQDEVTRQVVAALEVRLSGKSVSRGEAGTSNLEALDLFLRGRGLLSAPDQDSQTNSDAIALLYAALDRDPNYVDPRVKLVIGHATAYSSRWTDDPAGALASARRAAEEAVALAPGDGDVRAARALVALLEKDHERLRAETELAISLTPDGGMANILRGGYLVNDGQALAAIPHYERAIRVDPGMTHLFIHHLGTAYLFAQRYETAAALFRSRIVLSPRTDISRGYLCVALGHLGLREEAHRVWAELMAINPNFSLRERLTWWRYRDSADPERLLEGLRKAGLPIDEQIGS